MVSDRLRIRFELSVLAVLALTQATVSFLPSFGFGQPIADASDQVATALTPVDFAFSIWGLIYAGILITALKALVRGTRNDGATSFRWLAIACGANTLWQLNVQAFGLNYLSTIFIVILLVSSLAAAARLGASHSAIKSPYLFDAYSTGLLAGWISAATIVNLWSTLRFYGFQLHLTDAASAGALIAAGLGVFGAQIWLRLAPSYLVAFGWAMLGIAVAGFRQEASVVPTIAALLGVVATLSAWGISKRELQNRGNREL